MPCQPASQEVLAKALYFLARREHSKKELIRKLHRSPHFSAASIHDAIQYCIEQNWQSDERYAKMYRRVKQAAGYGPVYIRMQLSSHAIHKSVVDSSVPAEFDFWSGSMRAFCHKKGYVLDADFVKQQKIKQSLYRRGFPMAWICDLMKQQEVSFDEDT